MIVFRGAERGCREGRSDDGRDVGRCRPAGSLVYERMFDELSSDQLVEELAAQAAHVSAGIARLVELATACGERVPLALEGSTFPGWLAWRCGVLPREAREL